jgi:hypothetical protein
MMQLYVLVLICASANPICTPDTARAYQAFVAPPGIIICGVPATTTIVQSATAPNEQEYIRTRCVPR